MATATTATVSQTADDEIEMVECDECGCEMTQDEYDERQEISDGLWSEIEDLVGSWSAETYEVSNMRRLLAFAKKLHDQSVGA